MNSKLKYVSIFILLLFFCISLVNASDINDTATNTKTIEYNNNVLEHAEYGVYTDNLKEDKVLVKKSQKSTKESGNTIIFNSTTFDNYVSNNQLNDNVNDGDTLDFQGIMYGERFKLTINKPVNIISSTNDAFYGDDRELGFTINQGGSGTNLTNVHFYNTHLVVYNATNVIIDNVTVEVQHCIVGSGQGVTSIREESSHVLVSNSYFLSNDTGGVSTLVCAGAQNVRLENNTVIAKSMVGNLVYFTTYNLNTKKSNENITLINTYIDGTDAISQSICVPLVIQGKNHKIINNTIRHNITGISWTVMAQMVSGPGGIDDMIHDENSVVGNMFVNNSIVGNFSLSNSYISGNKLEHISVKNAVVTNNEVGKLILNGNTTCYDNTVKELVVNANNTVTGNDYVNLIINSTNNTIQNNRGWYLVDESNMDNFTMMDNVLVINNSDIADENILFDLENSDVKFIKLNNLSNKNLRFTSPVDGIVVSGNNISIMDTQLPESLLTIGENSNITLVNSTFLEAYLKNNVDIDEVNTNIITDENNQLLSKKDELNNFNPKEYQDFFNTTTHKLHDSIKDNTNIIIKNALDGEKFTQPIIIDKKVNITGLNKTQWNGDIIFNKGSEGSCLTNMIINATIYINTSNIHITNNTIKQQIKIENSNNNQINNNNINTTETAIIMKNTTKTEITENNITTTATNTITIDAKSQENTITNNYLISKDNNSSHTINTNTNNIINHNKPEQNTTLSIQVNPNIKRNIPSIMNISLKSNGKDITTGELIILSNGIELEKIILNNQKVTQTTLLINETGENKIKVFYFPTDIYSQATATNKTTVKPVENYMDIQISETKINENATITVSLTNEYGDKIQEGTILLNIQNYTIESEIINGTSTTILPALEEYKGKTLTITYTGSENSTNLTTKLVFNPLKGESFIELASENDGTNTVITATVTNILGEKINKGYVQFRGYGTPKLVKINDYKAVLTIPTSDTTINATFRNNANYEEATTNITITATKDTNIQIKDMKTISYGENVTITGTLTDNDNNTLKNMPLSLKVNNKNITLTTDNNGIFTHTTQATIIGTNNVTATYDGNSNYNPRTTSKTFIVQKQDTKITLKPIPNTTYNTNVTLTGTLTDKNDNTLKNMQVTIQINNETNTTTTNNNGVFTFTFKTPTSGQNNITITYNGNNNYKASKTSTTFNVNKLGQKITLDKIKDVVYGHEVTIKGTFTDGQTNPRANIALRIFINGKSVSTRTDSNGQFSVTSKVGSIGTNNVTASHAGGTNYDPTNTSTTFKMIKQDLKITVDKISTIVYGSSVKITGTLKDGDNNIRANTGVKILINGKSATAKTDKTGKYTFTTKIGKLGVNNVTVSHAGGTNYNPTSNSTTYTVVKQDLKIILNNIGTVTYGSVTITGRFTDSNGNPRANTGLKITINEKTATAKTNDKGEFTLTTKVGIIGINNVTAYHNGGSNYNPTSTSTTFTMVKQDLKVTIDPINTVTYGNSVVITGKFTDASGKVRANSALKIIINGKTLTTRTDANGKFRATSKVGVIGTNNVTVSHNGGTGFNPTSTSTTFKMLKQDLKITINPINTVKKGSTLTVTGTFTDANGKIRTNTNLKVKLNGVEHTTKTDSKGVFTFKTTANKVGTNTIIIAHTGGANYNPTNTTKTFTVTS